MIYSDKAPPRSDSRTNSQLGSVLQLNAADTYDIESDTPPIDTLSWSNMGIKFEEKIKKNL